MVLDLTIMPRPEPGPIGPVFTGRDLAERGNGLPLGDGIGGVEPGLDAAQVLVTPTPFNTLLWRILIMDESGYYEGYYSLFDDKDNVPMHHYPSNRRLLADMEVCVAEEVPIIITSLNPPREIVQAVHSYGGLVFHDIISMRHARKAIEQGVDGLIAVCAGAGGHAGPAGRRITAPGAKGTRLSCEVAVVNGKVTSISGATVCVDLPDLKIGDRVFVGINRLTGEVVRLEGGIATVQVFEDNRGLGIGEPVKSAQGPLTVQLGPGLLGGVFDGLQRPLDKLQEISGDFISSGQDLFPLDCSRRWEFNPACAAGDVLEPGEAFGKVQEGHIDHLLLSPQRGRLAKLHTGSLQLEQPAAQFEDGQPLFGWHSWPVRKARPVRRKLPPATPLVTGQRCLDFLFPMLKGGVSIVPGGFGTGKTVLEQTIAKFADVDVVVYVGCGERGNEMAGVLHEFPALLDQRNGICEIQRTCKYMCRKLTKAQSRSAIRFNPGCFNSFIYRPTGR